MRHASLILIAALAGCASADVAKMSPVELCYTSRVDESNKSKADAEIAKRKVDCGQYNAEVQKMYEMEQRAGGGTGEYSEGKSKAPSPKGY
jgi:hypothetical protein